VDFTVQRFPGTYLSISYFLVHPNILTNEKCIVLLQYWTRIFFKIKITCNSVACNYDGK